MNFRTSMFAFAVAASAFVIQACGGSSGSGSCTYTVASANYTECFSYGSAYPSSSAMSACTALGSTASYSTSSCPTVSGGTCTIGTGSTAEVVTISGDGGITTQSYCMTAGGTYAM